MQPANKQMLIGELVTEQYGHIISFLKDDGGFALSFIAGMFAILFHAKSRLQITAPRGEEYDFVRLLSLPALVGRDQFRRLFLIYVILLEIFFIFLCLVKPLFPNIIGNTPNYQGPAWPLGAALVIVGVLPTVPGIDQIELGLRRFSLSAADIPDEFFRRVTHLTQSEIRKYLESDPRYRAELSRYWKIHNLTLAAGLSLDEANEAARRAIGLIFFSKWTVDDSSIWQEGEREKLKEVFDLLRPKVASLKQELDELANDTFSSQVVEHIFSRIGVSVTEELTAVQIDAISELVSTILAVGRYLKIEELSDEDIAKHAAAMQEYHDLANTWRAKILDLSKSNRRLCAVFATLAVNDRETAVSIVQSPIVGAQHQMAGNIMLREMLVLVNKVSRRSAAPIYNSTVVATVCAFVVCFAFLYAYRVIGDYRIPPAPPKPGDPIRAGAFEFALATSLTLAVTFLSAGLAALFFRNVRLPRGTYIKYESPLQFQILQYRWTGIAILLSAFIPYTIATILYAFRMGDVSNLIDLDRFGSLSLISFCIAWSLVPTTFAIGLCSTADIIPSNQGTHRLVRTSIFFSLVVGFIAFLVLKTFTLVDARYGEIFWSNLTSAMAFSMAVLCVFAFSGRQHMRRVAAVIS
jgi:hypothetical protein